MLRKIHPSAAHLEHGTEQGLTVFILFPLLKVLANHSKIKWFDKTGIHASFSI
jgi:hypothetical protein